MPKHIGIVAVSPEGTAICYREVFRHARRIIGNGEHPAITLHNEPFERYVDAALADDWESIGAMLLSSNQTLAQAGADFCIAPDNVMQFGINLIERSCPIPWLKMGDLIADAVERDQRQRIGLIGTRMVMAGTVYQVPLGLKGVALIRPDESDIDEIDRIIFNELVYGITSSESTEAVIGVLSRLATKGCDGVILGCSEAPLIINEHNSPLPLYDANGILAEGAVRVAIEEMEIPG